jgi:hypothetical protein
LLCFGALLLTVSALTEGLELVRHVLNGPSEVGQLAGDERSLLLGRHRVVWPDSTPESGTKMTGPATKIPFALELLASRASRVGGLQARAGT